MFIFYFCWSFLSWKWSLENPRSKHLNSHTYHSKRLQCPSIKRYQHTCERCVPKRSRSRVNHFWNQSRRCVESGSTTLVAVGKSWDFLKGFFQAWHSALLSRTIGTKIRRKTSHVCFIYVCVDLIICFLYKPPYLYCNSRILPTIKKGVSGTIFPSNIEAQGFP